MPANRNALLRYKTRDKCLQNRFRKWTLQDLIDACSDTLYEYEGIDKGISRRTIQADIQMMRSDKLGYNAPIIVVDKRYYTYEDPDYTITNIPLSNQDLARLSDTVAFLKQFKDFSHFKELDGMIQKLEDQVFAKSSNREPVIDFEKNENLKGLEFLDQLYQRIVKEKTIEVCYKSFRAKVARKFILHPYLLKEYRNRWFVFGLENKGHNILTLALDRIVSLAPSEIPLHKKKDFDRNVYFKNIVGVTVNPNDNVQRIVLFIEKRTAPYILTKPIHASQEVVEEDEYGTTISLNLQINYELERVILGYGAKMKVLSPLRLKRRIKAILKNAVDIYESEVNARSLRQLPMRLHKRGIERFEYCYSRKEVKVIRDLCSEDIKELNPDLFAQYPKLRKLIYNKNFKQIIQAASGNDLRLLSARYNEAGTQNNLQQRKCILLPKKKDWKGKWKKDAGCYLFKPKADFLRRCLVIYIFLLPTSEKQTQLIFLPGSQKEKMSKKKLAFICRNALPQETIVDTGGVIIMEALLVHALRHTNKKKKFPFIELVFLRE